MDGERQHHERAATPAWGGLLPSGPKKGNLQ